MKKAVLPTLVSCLLAVPVAAERHRLVDIHFIDPTIEVDMRYATAANFLSEILYPHNACLLREDVAERLAKVQDTLKARGLGLKVWDCYRPLSIQKRLWKKLPDDRYVANPNKGSRHNRGAAVDVTLTERFGRELEMPTAYDDFSEKAHRNYWQLSPEQLENRGLLEASMKAQGFEGLDTEWWHFDGPRSADYPIMDEPLTDRFLWPVVSRQAILVLVDDWPESTGELDRFEKSKQGWAMVGESWPVSLGKGGMAWGRGLQPEQLPGPQKEEGDGKTPAGIYTLGPTYGDTPPSSYTTWPYLVASDALRCVDDPGSRYYNRIVDSTSVTVDWTSEELIRRQDDLYRRLIVVNANTQQIIPGKGSCIFLHLWRAPGSPTAGCTSLERSAMETLLQWLDPAKAPLLIQLPRREYEKYKGIWDLPGQSSRPTGTRVNRRRSTGGSDRRSEIQRRPRNGGDRENLDPRPNGEGAD